MTEPVFKAAFEKNPILGCGLTLAIISVGIGALLQSCSGSSDKTPTPQSSYEAARDEEIRVSTSTKVEAESNLEAGLKDGGSAEFRNETVYKLTGGNLILCGEVNSKNSFGGYSGFKRFIASPNPEAPATIEGETILGHTASRKTFNKAFNKACADPVHTFKDY